MLRQFGTIISKEDDMYVSFCPELDIASQGATIDEAKSNLREAIELFFEHASENEINTRLNPEVYYTQTEVEIA